MKKFGLAAGAAVLAMGATALFAAPGDMGAKMGGMHAKIDADGNGSVTHAEAQAAANAAWARMDVNKDGKLDPADRAAQRAAMFDKIDADHNGAISRAEFDALRGPGGMRGPGGPGREGMPGHEGMAGHEGMGGPDGGKRGHRMGRGGPGHHGMGGPGGGMMAMGKMADTNADGAVSRAEFDAGVAKVFAMADANNDGTITQAERLAAREKMRTEWKAKRAAPAASTTN